jgi:hypothetical protein
MVVVGKYVGLKSLECGIDVTELGCIGSLEGVEALSQVLLTLFRGVSPRHGHKRRRNWLKGKWVRGKHT